MWDKDIYIYMGSRLASYIGGLSTKIESPYVERDISNMLIDEHISVHVEVI